MAEYAGWVDEGVSAMQAAVGRYMDTPSREHADLFVASVRAAFDVHFSRIGNRLRTDATFAERTRLYGVDLRDPAVRFTTLAIDAAREGEGDAEGLVVLQAWLRDDLLPATTETAFLERELAAKGESPPAGRPAIRRAGSASDPASSAPLPDAPVGWVRVDDSRAFGARWREALDWPAEGTPGWDMLNGNYGLFIRLDGTTDQFDSMAAPVFLATGLRATAAGRAVVAAAVKGDVECAEGKQQEASLCKTSTVIDSLADPICSHYDGRGNVFLAECDCLKQLQLPSVLRLRSSCEAAAMDPASGVTAKNCTDMAPSTSDKELRTWPVRDMTKLRAPILANNVYRYAVRSQRRLNAFQGTFAACTYPPCMSTSSANTSYVDARTTAMEKSRCPLMRCEASINTDWVGGNVEIDGTMLKVRCSGGACMRPDGTPKCRNDGRCLQDGKCNCEGTGFRGDTCEQRIGSPEGPTTETTTETTTAETVVPEIAGPLEKPRSLFEVRHLLEDLSLAALGLGIALGVMGVVYLLRSLFARKRQDEDAGQEEEGGGGG
jgi:hypothetical protein